jgi:hypothetical protein
MYNLNRLADIDKVSALNGTAVVEVRGGRRGPHPCAWVGAFGEGLMLTQTWDGTGVRTLCWVLPVVKRTRGGPALGKLNPRGPP